MTLTRPTVRAFRFIREIQLAYSQRTIQGVYKDVFVKHGKLHFTHDLSQIADGDFLWSDNPFGNVSDIDERDKHAVLEFSQCTRELANLAPIIDIILKGKFCNRSETSPRALDSCRFQRTSILVS